MDLFKEKNNNIFRLKQYKNIYETLANKFLKIPYLLKFFFNIPLMHY